MKLTKRLITSSLTSILVLLMLNLGYADFVRVDGKMLIPVEVSNELPIIKELFDSNPPQHDNKYENFRLIGFQKLKYVPSTKLPGWYILFEYDELTGVKIPQEEYHSYILSNNKLFGFNEAWCNSFVVATFPQLLVAVSIKDVEPNKYPSHGEEIMFAVIDSARTNVDLPGETIYSFSDFDLTDKNHFVYIQYFFKDFDSSSSFQFIQHRYDIIPLDKSIVLEPDTPNLDPTSFKAVESWHYFKKDGDSARELVVSNAELNVFKHLVLDDPQIVSCEQFPPLFVNLAAFGIKIFGK